MTYEVRPDLSGVLDFATIKVFLDRYQEKP
jgi:hypothetical protein